MKYDINMTLFCYIISSKVKREYRMKKILIISSAVIGLLYAVDTVPNDFTSGEIIKASEINANFDHLSNLITSLRSQIDTLSNSSDNKKFVGLSSETVVGNSGILTVNNTCNNDYPGSKICSIKEIYNSSDALNATGIAWYSSNTCSSFSYFGLTGASKISFPSGKIATGVYCNQASPIACCK